ncbi:hypothetical protein P7M42_23440, partial [Vibrio parahaemolyticus]|nr:hypothetical protein [Vibrio parahaemolyticus]
STFSSDNSATSLSLLSKRGFCLDHDSPPTRFTPHDITLPANDDRTTTRFGFAGTSTLPFSDWYVIVSDLLPFASFFLSVEPLLQALITRTKRTVSEINNFFIVFLL